MRSSWTTSVSLKPLVSKDFYLVSVRLHDGPLRDGEELLRLYVGPHHHGQHRQQLLLADVVVTIEVVHPESEVKLLLSGIEFVFRWVLLDRSEVRHHTYEVLTSNNKIEVKVVSGEILP